jgi:hypothetical protein
VIHFAQQAAQLRSRLVVAPQEKSMGENSSVTLPGKVEEIVLSSHGPEKVKIKVGDLSQPLRIKNKLTDADGNETHLNLGDNVQTTVKAPPDSTTQSSQP